MHDPLVSTLEESLQLRVLERILVEHRAVSVSQEVFGKASNVLVGDLREGCPSTQSPHIEFR